MPEQLSAPSTDFSGVFDRLVGTVGTLGGQYLTLRGQTAIAESQARAQARINEYSRVNPSLGPVNPSAAMATAAKSPVQSWLPWGSPIVGTDGTVANNAVSPAYSWQKYVVYILGAVLAVLLVVKFLKK